jgi:hypothetical protein
MKTAVEYIKEKLMCDEYWYENMTFDQIFEKALEMEKKREKSIFSIAYRMTPIEFGKEYCELEFEKFNKTFKQQEQ